MKRVSASILGAMLLASQVATAEGFKFNKEQAYVGGALGYNSFSNDTFDSVDNAVGFQVFGGYDLGYKLADQVNTLVEVGYMSTGDFEIKNCTSNPFFSCTIDALQGLWAAGLVSYPINPQVELLGRLGLDLGDDDGLMFGFGGGYDINDKFNVRAEYVIRDSTNSLQANLVYFLK